MYTGTDLPALKTYLGQSPFKCIGRFSGSRTYLDTFDWCLLRKKMGIHIQNNDLTLLVPDTGYPERIRIKRRPHFSADLPPGNIRLAVHEVAGIRALIPAIKEHVSEEQYVFLDNNQKTVLRMVIESANLAGSKLVFVELFPVRGYENLVNKVGSELRGIGFHSENRGFLEYLIEVNQVDTDRWSTKKSYPIHPGLSVAGSVKVIHRQLLGVLRENEGGIIKDIDTEFLHDFRVAVRRIRSLYGQVRHIIDASVSRKAKADFSALGKRTNRLRDIDVYLLNRRSYQELLPAAQQPALTVFFDRLTRERKAEHARIAGYLQSQTYRRQIAGWENILKGDAEAAGDDEIPVLEFAAKQILNRYTQVNALGDRINDLTPDSKLHKLRIAGKKLRYTLEFYAALFDPDAVADMIRHLKKLQDNLGEFNDLSVQQSYLYAFALQTEGGRSHTTETVVAFGILIGRLYHRQRTVRREFRENFEYFTETRQSKWISDLSQMTETDKP